MSRKTKNMRSTHGGKGDMARKPRVTDAEIMARDVLWRGTLTEKIMAAKKLLDIGAISDTQFGKILNDLEDEL